MFRDPLVLKNLGRHRRAIGLLDCAARRRLLPASLGSGEELFLNEVAAASKDGCNDNVEEDAAPPPKTVVISIAVSKIGEKTSKTSPELTPASRKSASQVPQH